MQFHDYKKGWAIKFYNSDLNFDWESGDFQIMVGPNARAVEKITINWVK